MFFSQLSIVLVLLEFLYFHSTDSWAAYNRLPNLGYIHSTVNHTYRFVDVLDNTCHINTIEGLWHDVKETIRHQRGVRHIYIDLCLKEFMFRRYFRHHNMFRTMMTIIAAYNQ